MRRFPPHQTDQVGAGVPAQWELEYTFAQTYGAQTYTPAHIAALAQHIRSDMALRQTFERYYAVEATTSPIKAENWQSFACA